MRNLYLLLKVIVIALMFFKSLFAVGVSVTGIGPRATSLGGSFRAISQDWSGMYWNPAGITQIEKWHFGLTTEMLLPRGTYKPALWNDSMFSVTRQTQTPNETQVFFAPSGGVVYKLSERVTVGLGGWVPFALGGKWDLLETSHYNSTFPEYEYVNDLKTFDIHPTVAFKLNDMISLGGGVGVVYGNIMILQPIFNPNPYLGVVEYGGINLLEMVGSGFQDSLKNVGGLSSTFNHLVAESKLAASGFGYSANLGLMAKINDRFQIGISGRYYGDIKLTGTLDATMYYATNSEAQQLVDSRWSDTTLLRYRLLQSAYKNGRIKEYEKDAVLNAYSGGTDDIYTNAKAVFSLPLPPDVGIGISYKVINKNNRHLIFCSDFQYTFSSVWKVIDIDINNGQDTFQLVQNWENSYRVSLGIEYKMNPLWIFRSAYYYEKNAGIIETLTPTIPDINPRNGVTLGFQFNIRPKIALQCNYEGIFFLRQSFDKWVYNLNNSGYDNMAGTYTFNVNKVMLSVDYNF